MLYQTLTQSAKFHNDLQDLLDEISGLAGRSIICGDINCPSMAISGMLDQRLVDILIMNVCRQHVSEPTHRYCGLLDLLITSNRSSVIIPLPTNTELSVSDHFVVQSVLNLSWSRPSTVKFCCRNFKSLNISFAARYWQVASVLCVFPKTTMNEFVVQLRDDVVAISDKLAQLKQITTRRGSRTNSQVEAVAPTAGCLKRRSILRVTEEWSATTDIQRLNWIILSTE